MSSALFVNNVECSNDEWRFVWWALPVRCNNIWTAGRDDAEKDISGLYEDDDVGFKHQQQVHFVLFGDRHFVQYCLIYYIIVQIDCCCGLYRERERADCCVTLSCLRKGPVQSINTLIVLDVLRFDQQSHRFFVLYSLLLYFT